VRNWCQLSYFSWDLEWKEVKNFQNRIESQKEVKVIGRI
jgi:hypothetical protein